MISPATSPLLRSLQCLVGRRAALVSVIATAQAVGCTSSSDGPPEPWCRQDECIEDERDCHPPADVRLTHVQSNTLRETAIEYALRTCVYSSLYDEASPCALATTCASPSATCEGDPFASGPFELALSCDNDVVQAVECVARNVNSAVERHVRIDVAASENDHTFLAIDETTGIPFRELYRALSPPGDRTTDTERQIDADGPSLGALVHHFTDDLPTRRDYWVACDDGTTACLTRILGFTWNPERRVDSIDVDEDANMTTDVSYTLNYIDGRIVSILESTPDGGSDDILVSACCSHDTTCAGYRELDESIFVTP